LKLVTLVMKQKHLEMYLNIAEVAAKASYARRLKVGACAVRDHRILSIGYNGTPPGTDNNCEDEFPDPTSWQPRLKTKPEVIHAEKNLIYKMARDGESAKGADLFITHAPCFECSKAILATGFRKVYWRHEYRATDGIEYLRQHGVEVDQI
jgi:dCMP deaminase